MTKNKAKDSIVVNAGNGNYIPNIVRGGAAIPIGKKNFYYMQGRKHEQGGIDVGRNAKTGLEVEGEEVMQVTPNEVRVYSSVPFLRGVSPAELVLNGADANKVFAAQEKYKNNNRINDDGTKYKYGGINNKQYYANNNSVSFRNNNKNNKTKNQKLYNKNNNIAFKYLANNDNIEYNDNDNINITNKSKMGKLVSINGNVKNGLIHTPNQDIIESINNDTPRKGNNQSSSSSTGDVNNRTSKSAKTRNIDNILLGVNLGSSVLDAVMGNIYANQMHGYTAPNITAPTIKNPGEIKLNEEDLKDIPAPILMAAAKLKTRYNANPQLSKIEDDTRRIMGEIGRNTSNSRVALARKQRAALQGQQAKNEVYGRKENIETELINKDKLNQQEVTARNLARYDQYNQALAAQRANRARLRLAADTANIQNKLAISTANAQLKSQADRFNTTNRINQLMYQAGIDAAKAEARSNIFSGMLGNIGSALNTWNRNKRQAKLDEETLRVLGLRTPNANKLVLSALGY